MEKNRRCYKQFCGVAKALDVVGDRWTLLIVRDLLLGPWRYKDLLQRLPGMTTNLLAARLKEMEGDGLISKTQQSSIGSSHTYELTEMGRQLEPVILSLGQFGLNFMRNGPQGDEKLDIGRALLSLKNRYSGTKSGSVCLVFVGESPDQQETHYRIHFSKDYVDISNQMTQPCSLQVRLDFSVFRELAFVGHSVSALRKSGRLTLLGNDQTWKDFIEAFGFAQ